MRVLYLTNSAQIGGGNRSLLALWEGLRPLGITPLAVCPAEGPMIEACRRADVGCEVVEYHPPDWQSPLRGWRAFRRWVSLLDRLGVDLVHANDPYGARTVGLAAKWSHVPLVCHIHFPLGDAGTRWIFRFTPKPHAFLFCSEALRQEVNPALARACPGVQQAVVHNPVSTEDFCPMAAPPGPRPRIGIVANLLPVKGHLDFLEMARALTDRGVDADYWIIGEDIHRIGSREALQLRAAELHLQDRVTFWGHRSNIPELMNELDVVVCSSHVEPFGMCLIEAMACEKPVVATRVGGIPEIVEDGVCGLLTSPRAPHELADAVERLLLDSDLRRRIAVAGRQRVLRCFTRDAFTSRVVEIYRGLSRGGYPPERSFW